MRLETTPESSLLLTLEEISRLVSHSHDPGQTLSNIVALIQGRFRTDVCSVYLLEPDSGELVLVATIGLDPAGVGRVRLRLDEGLTGLVAQTMAPVMADEAPSHPRFKYVAELGEDRYHSFLGVPLIEAGVVEGVMVIQTVEPRSFSPDEIRMLVTVASQLAPLISGARLLGQVVAAAHEEAPAIDEAAAPETPMSLSATPLSPGVGLGRAFVVDGLNDEAHGDSLAADPAEERRKLAEAVDAAREEITRLSRRISDLVGESHGAILQAQLMILQDRSIERDIDAALDAGRSAEAALLQTLDKYVAAFQRLSNPFFQERVYDVKDVFRRVLRHLRPTAMSEAGTDRVVLVAKEASVLDLLSIEPDRLAAVAVAHGGPQCHAAILARSLGIPMVGQAPDLLNHVRPDGRIRVDGSAGLIELEPPPEPIVEDLGEPEIIGADGLPACAVGRDDLPRVEVNINLLCEVESAVAQGVGGVGLYRTEFLFLARRTSPTEEEQVGIYRKLLLGLEGRPASIRTFDLRPDKLGHYAYLTDTSAQQYDWRRVLDVPALQVLFRDQVRAILRASAVGPARILVPHVTRTELLDFVLETVASARDALRKEGLEQGADVPVGIMIEVAAAVPMIPVWAGRVDYVSLGTNDLVASALGIDRDDATARGDGDPLHPGVLRLISDAVSAIHAAGRQVTVCGELAADPEGMLALAALGVDTLSVPVKRLAGTRCNLAHQAPDFLSGLALQLRQCASAREVRDLLQPLTR